MCQHLLGHSQSLISKKSSNLSLSEKERERVGTKSNQMDGTLGFIFGHWTNAFYAFSSPLPPFVITIFLSDADYVVGLEGEVNKNMPQHSLPIIVT